MAFGRRPGNIGTGGVSDPSYSSGADYARSIAGGQNVPNMIAPGVSYSAAQPEGYTQADLNEANRFYSEGPVLVRPDLPSTGNNYTQIPDQMPFAPPGTTIERLEPIKNLYNPFDFTNIQSIIDSLDLEKISQNLPQTSEPLSKEIIDNIKVTDMLPEPSYPSLGASLFNNENIIPAAAEPIPLREGNEVNTLQNSLNELESIVSSKDLLQNIPANDGTERNLYQTTVNDFINASPINEEIYKETFPISAALPDVAQTLATAAVPGLGLIPNVEESFNEFSTPSIMNPLLNVPTTTPNYGFDMVKKFGR